MSQAEMIRQGQLQLKRNARLQLKNDVKAALRSLINEATYAQDKAAEDIDISVLTAHMDRLIEKQTALKQIDTEIAELSY